MKLSIARNPWARRWRLRWCLGPEVSSQHSFGVGKVLDKRVEKLLINDNGRVSADAVVPRPQERNQPLHMPWLPELHRIVVVSALKDILWVNEKKALTSGKAQAKCCVCSKP